MKTIFVLAVACVSLLVIDGCALTTAPTRSAPALSTFAVASAGITAYNATITVFEQQAHKAQNVVFRYTFRKPTTVTVDVVGGPNDGVSLLWTGGTTVSAHRGGLAGMVKRTLSLHDPKVATIRGSSIDELSFVKILTHALQTPGTLSEGPGVTINDVPTEAVTLIPSQPATDAGYTREIIEISRASHLPLRVLGYVGSTLVRKVDFVDVKFTN